MIRTFKAVLGWLSVRLVLACAVLLAWPVSIWADQGQMEKLAVSASAAIAWSQTQPMDIHGMPGHWREFESGLPMHEVAELFSGHAALFQRVLAFRRGMLLSGVQGDWHWAAEIHALPSGARGRVSALQTGGANETAGVSAVPRQGGRFPWLEGVGTLGWRHEKKEGRRRELYEVHVLAASIDETLAYLQRNLRQDGWQSEPSLALASGAQAWRRENARLLAIAVQLNGRGSLFLNVLD